MSSIVSIDTRGYDISMGPGMLRVGGGGGLAGNVYINGNVGIGTSSPSNGVLDVSGTLRVGSGIGGLINLGQNGVGGYRSAYINSTSTDLYILNQQPGAFQFGTNNAERMRITGTGSVGIGTSSPAATLDVSNVIAIKSQNTVGYNQTSTLGFGYGGGSTIGTDYRWKVDDITYNRDSGVGPYYDYGVQSKLIFRCKSNNLYGGAANDKVYQDGLCLVPNSGGNGGLSTGINVGIGTTSPTATLDVNGTARMYCAGLGTGGSYLNFGGVNGNFTIIDSAGTSAGLGFNINGTERMRITSSGSVGIGTSSPLFKLTVEGGRICASGASFEGTVTSTEEFGTSSIILNTTGTPSSKSFIGSRGINGGGGVGFVFSRGASFQTQVQVYTNVASTDTNFTGSLSTAGPYVASGGTSWTTSSDERLKDNITELPDDTLDIISNIHAVNFTWKNDTLNKKCIGFIAQNVQEYYPEVVNNSSTGYLGVDYTSMIPVLLKSIQQLKTKLDDTKQTLDDALQRIQILESK